MKSAMMTHNRPAFSNNFGAIRYILALVVVMTHYNELTGSNYPVPFSTFYSVSGFFILSGFLIFGSFMSSANWKEYLKKRVSRIFPSYLVIVVIFAFLLFFISEMPPHDYFSADWVKYLAANITTLNFIKPTIHNIFANNHIAAVNGSLWTIKVELMLYLTAIPVLLIYKKTRIDFWKLFIFIIIFSTGYKLFFDYAHDLTGKNIYQLLSKQFGGQMAFFYSGVAFCIYLDYIKKYKLAVATMSTLTLIAGTAFVNDSQIFRLIILPISMAGLIVSAAFTGKWGHFVDKIENFSYEIYLIHFPIIQIEVHFGLTDKIGHHATLIAVMSTVCVLSYLIARYISLPIRSSLKKRIRPSVSQASVSQI